MLKCPAIIPIVVVADDAELAAQLSCVLAKPNAYLPVVDGPRMERKDREAEATRRNNGVARTKAEEVFYAGLSTAAEGILEPYLGRLVPQRIMSGAEVRTLAERRNAEQAPLLWGRDQIGLGLLTALRSGKLIEFTDQASPTKSISPKSNHLVICEAGEPLSEVIAANYAFSLKAGLCVIPEHPKHETRILLEAFYSLYDNRDVSPTEKMRELASILRGLCADVTLPSHGSLTFVTGGLPYGFAFPELPSTHLFKYPDLGLTIINGFAAEQPKTRGTNIALLLDPQTTDAPEIDAAADLLADRGLFVRGQRGAGATVYEASRAIELYPYDLLILATHCGDAGGTRQTYRFIDGDGRDRTLVVDVAVGIADPRRSENDRVEVVSFERFHSLDGVLLDDPELAQKLDIGRAKLDYLKKTREEGLKPSSSEDIPRVVDSAALKMFDYNYLALPRSLAEQGTPIIINNACASWRELAERFTFLNARAYIGTLFPIATSEAHDVVIGVLGKYFDKALPHAFWSAQNAVYGGAMRRPYIVTGVYTQRLRVTKEDTPRRIYDVMQRALRHWRERVATLQQEGLDEKGMGNFVTYYEREVGALGARLAQQD